MIRRRDVSVRRAAPAALPLALAAAALLLAPAHAAAEPETAAEIEACVRENLPDETSIQTVSLESRDRVGATTSSRAKIYWQRGDDGLSRVMLRIYAPPDMRGAGLLLLEKEADDDMFMYLPELARVRRVTSRMASTSMFGTDFTYEQFERIQGLAENVESKRLDDAEVGGRAVFVVETRPGDPKASGFESIRSYVEKATCLPIRVEYFEHDQMRKVLEADLERIEVVSGTTLTRRLVMKDLRDETSTALVIEEIELGTPIKRKTFTKNFLETGQD